MPTDNITNTSETGEATATPILEPRTTKQDSDTQEGVAPINIEPKTSEGSGGESAQPEAKEALTPEPKEVQPEAKDTDTTSSTTDEGAPLKVELPSDGAVNAEEADGEPLTEEELQNLISEASSGDNDTASSSTPNIPYAGIVLIVIVLVLAFGYFYKSKKDR